MIFVNSTYADFIKRLGNKKIIIFGASALWDYYTKIFTDIVPQVVDRTLFVVDNASSKQGKTWEIQGRKIKIKSVNELYFYRDYTILIAVSMAYQEDICVQLSAMGLPKGIECYSLPLMIHGEDNVDNSCVEKYFSVDRKVYIPAKIHSFWFSGEEKPEIYKRCIESWHKFCPEYEIIEWNTDNYDIEKNRYMRQAFEQKKWAFVSDYARLDVVYEQGGIYLDMDVELTASIDWLRNASAFFCRQEDGFVELGSGFGALPENKLIEEMLAEYKNKMFMNSAGVMDMTPQPERLSGVFKKHNISICHDSQIIEDMVFLSNNYIICGHQSELSEREKTKIGVHWHNAGWLEKEKREIFRKSSEAMPVLLKKYFKNSDFAD